MIKTLYLGFPNNNVSNRRFSFTYIMFNLAETILDSMALKHKVMAIQKEVSRRLDIKSKITEWIKRVLEIV